jgi:hypothetical protein
MDYLRIYNAFIADRRLIKPPLYFETHHVLPRCMGGTDDLDNLVRLSPEDHFFAHLLLAKTHGKRDLWAACILMASFTNANGRLREVIRSRRLYGLVRRQYSAISVGEMAPNADTTKRQFYHWDGQVFFGTRMAFAEYSGIPAANVNGLVRGRSKETGGWSLKYIDKNERNLAISKTMSESGKKLKGFVRDKEIYHFFNESSGLSVLGTQIGLQNIEGLTRNKTSALVIGTTLSTSGWCLAENAEFAFARGSMANGWVEWRKRREETIQRRLITRQQPTPAPLLKAA